jgi:hypothetical protein
VKNVSDEDQSKTRPAFSQPFDADPLDQPTAPSLPTLPFATPPTNPWMLPPNYEPPAADAAGSDPARTFRRLATLPPRRQMTRRQWAQSYWTTRRVLLLLVLFSVVGLGVGGGVNALVQLQQVRSLARDGLRHLENARALVHLNQLDKALNATTLNLVRVELSGAEADFGALRRDLAHPQVSFTVAGHLPWTGSILASSAHLAAAADEACLAGLAFVQDGQLLVKILQGGLFASATTPAAGSAPPVLDTPTYDRLRAGLAVALQHLQLAVGYAQQADLSALPSSLVKPQQVTEIRQFLASWPQTQTALGQVNAALDVLPAVLGLSAPARYLVEVMDSTELRPGGGFFGNYTILTIANGKIQPFTLSDIYLLDKPYLEAHGGTVFSPAPYPWWPFSTIYGLRDSNLSGNFPTSARMGMQQLVREGGPAVQGVIAITPAAIEGIIHVIGPIAMPQYGQVVTDSNLEHLIHLYELVHSEQPLNPLPPNEQISSPEKRFTALLGKALVQKLHGLSLASQIAVGKQLFSSVHVKDIQVFLGDPKAEALLASHQADGAFPHSPADGVSIVDANVTPSKGSQFLTVAETDNVTLDAQGTATHTLTITYHFQVTNAAELYGPDYYRTYLRIYAPAATQLRSISGFTNLDGDDQIGHSDQPGYQMWGGFLIVQNGTPYTLRLTWQVPHAALRSGNGQHAYTLEYTRQAGLQQTLNTTVTLAGASHPAYHYAGRLDSDHYIALTY